MISKIEFRRSAFPLRVRVAICLLGAQRFLPCRGGIRNLIEKMYFLYRKYVDGGVHRLCKKHPEIFEKGHLIDIGSHIGTITEALSRSCALGYGVLSIEPEASNFETLRRQMKGLPNVWLQNLALSDKNHLSTLVKSPWHFGAHFLAGKGLSILHEDTQPVRCSTLDGVLVSLGWSFSDVSFVKIDTEGEEVRVLQGMPRVLASEELSVLVEICPEALHRQGSRALDLIQVLEDSGFRYFYRLSRFGDLHQVDPRGDLPERGWEDWLCRKYPIQGRACP